MAAKFIIFPAPRPTNPNEVRYKLLDKEGDILFHSEYFPSEKEARTHIHKLKLAAVRFTKVEVRENA